MISTAKLIQRRDAWLRKLGELGPMVRGSLVSVKRGNHTAHQLTVSIKGKTHTVYVPIGMVEEVREWTKNSRRMKRIIKEISKRNMALIHRYVPENRAVGRKSGPRRRNR